MKKIVLTLVVALMAISASAQVYVGGSLGFGSGKAEMGTEEVKSTSFRIMPEIGYELSESWSIGTVIGYKYSKLDEAKSNTFEVAPYARFFFFKSDLVRLFVDGGFGFATEKIEDEDDAMNTWNIGLKPGLAVKLSDNFSLIAKYGFLGYSSSKQGDAYKDHNFGLNLDSEVLSFGFHYIF